MPTNSSATQFTNQRLTIRDPFAANLERRLELAAREDVEDLASRGAAYNLGDFIHTPDERVREKIRFFLSRA